MEADVLDKSTENRKVNHKRKMQVDDDDAPGVVEEADSAEVGGQDSVAGQGPGDGDHLGLLRALLHVLLGPRLLGVGGRTVRSLSTNILLGLFDWESLRHGFPLLGPLCRKGSAAG